VLTACADLAGLSELNYGPVPDGGGYDVQNETDSNEASMDVEEESGEQIACEDGECSDVCKDCDGQSENGCEVDTTRDVDHCGVCGHGCQGGDCIFGVCTVSNLAGQQTRPWLITNDGASLYWTDQGGGSGDGSVFSIPIGGGTRSTQASKRSVPIAVAVDDTHVYWTEFGGGGGVFRKTKTGGAAFELASAMGGWALALSKSYVYWTNTDDGSIRRVALWGGASEVLAMGEGHPWGIAVGDYNLLWSNVVTGEIYRADLDGSNSVALVQGENHPTAIAVRNNRVYWTNAGSYSDGDCSIADGAVRSANVAGPLDLKTLASEQACPLGIQADGTDVFWVNTGTVASGIYNNDGSVMQAIEASDMRQLALGQSRPYGLTVSTSAVFWTNRGVSVGGGSIAKVAR